jgi:hypothetical protein
MAFAANKKKILLGPQGFFQKLSWPGMYSSLSSSMFVGIVRLSVGVVKNEKYFWGAKINPPP